MKTIIIILLFFASSLNAQFLRTTGNNLGIYNSGVNSSSFGSAFDSGLNLPNETFTIRAKQFFDRVMALGKTLTTAQQRWYNDSIFVPLIEDGIIGTTRAGDSLVSLYAFPLVFAGDSTIANMNLLADAYNCIHYGGVTYTDSGVVGNGTTGYLNTFFNPSADSSIFNYGSAGFGIYSKTDVDGEKDDMGASSSTTFLRSRASNNTRTRINSTSDVYSGSVVTDGRVIIIVVRNSSLVFNVFKNGTNIKSSTSTASGSLSTDNFYICASNGNGKAVNLTTKIYSFALICGGLSADKSNKLSTRLNNSLKGRNYNVY